MTLHSAVAPWLIFGIECWLICNALIFIWAMGLRNETKHAYPVITHDR